MKPEDMVLTTFKAATQIHSRSANCKWLTELFHDNPAWINPVPAKERGIADGDAIVIKSAFSELGRLVSIMTRLITACPPISALSWSSLPPGRPGGRRHRKRRRCTAAVGDRLATQLHLETSGQMGGNLRAQGNYPGGPALLSCFRGPFTRLPADRKVHARYVPLRARLVGQREEILKTG